MTFRQYAFNNVIRNKRTYAAHFLSSAFSVMMFFTYAMLQFHPDLQGELTLTSHTVNVFGKVAMSVAQLLIFVFSFFFLLYSVSSFLKTRKKEFGILLIHGITPKQLFRLVFMENMMIGIAAIMTGITVGIIFTKLILLIIATVLVIDQGLPFYLPWQAIALTFVAFLVLFLAISLFTSRMLKMNQLIELIKAEDKPKPELKASIWLSLLAVMLILAGYLAVYLFAINTDLVPLLIAGVGLTIIGTYFLFTQLSVYLIGWLRKQERLFFKRTNLLMFSELTYRMRDNANMFFMIAIASAVAFTAIGVCAAASNKGLSEMKNPYAFSYTTFSEHKAEQSNIATIKRKLEQAQIPYRFGTVTLMLTDNSQIMMNLSDYNSLSTALGYESETLASNEALLVSSKQDDHDHYKGVYPSNVLEVEQSNQKIRLNEKKAIIRNMIPDVALNSARIVVTDAQFEQFRALSNESTLIRKFYGFVVENWEQTTKNVSFQLMDEIGEFDEHVAIYYFNSLYLDWRKDKQENGLLMMSGVLVGIVFFTFAASFLYFRLYTDLEREKEQYQLISKLGLTKLELKKMVTQQLLLMFFLPIIVAIMHSSFAIFSLQQLVHYALVSDSFTIIACFVLIQVLYFAIIRWRYINKIHKTIS
ncbi:ABC transporter permease [Paenibacillus sp. 481]|uniref:ABC transporter permease n=1 Tax=Paenibacillus sp. 481 TaxID=2835869 RepID=UPI001E2CFBFE|nr:ABC transporter permease [Paenibacillus sp. 481]UHA72628.1 ABC transporter permease [Paenibacillus sp. 481]